MGPKHKNTLTETEILDFFNELDQEKRGWVSFADLQAKLHQFYQELEPETHKRHSRLSALWVNAYQTHDGYDFEKNLHSDALNAFALSLLPPDGSQLNARQFLEHVQAWNIPSQSQNSAEKQDAIAEEYERGLPIMRRLRARWALDGPQICFVLFICATQIALAIWELVKFGTSPKALDALGPGVVVAKGAVGVLYPTLLFMILSMSRWLAVFMRRWGPDFFSSLINWDLHQAFHVWMALEALLFSTIHSISHLTGSFLHGSRAEHQPAVARLRGMNGQVMPTSYANWLQSRPGWTGVILFGLFWTIASLSAPAIRKNCYELFQVGHVLMFPFLGFLCFHGTAQLLQHSMMGYWLAFPTVLVILERLHRLYRGLVPIRARLAIVDDETVSITCKLPRQRRTRYTAGQYVLLQVPAISWFQWHPFTISACREDSLKLHIKTDGNWTGKLRSLPNNVRIGIDGPFGAPAQRFYDFDRAIIIGSGIGVTPFSAIMTDLEQKLVSRQDPWLLHSKTPSVPNLSLPSSKNGSKIWGNPLVAKFSEELKSQLESIKPAAVLGLRPRRRVDFHWMVRERNHIQWFSDLLNRTYDLSARDAILGKGSNNPLDLNVHTYITARKKAVSTHIFRYLLDRYRDHCSPVSPITGLKTPSQFERPDMEKMIKHFHREMIRTGWTGGTVGVFFCGSPKIGRILADACAETTASAIKDGSRIRYRFLTEVFG